MAMGKDLAALNDYLFEELERLNDEDELKEDGALERETKRSKAIVTVAKTIIDNANTVLEAQKFMNSDEGDKPLPKMLSMKD